MLLHLSELVKIPEWSREARIVMISPALFTLASLLQNGNPKKQCKWLWPEIPKGRDLWPRFFAATFLDEAHLAVSLFTCCNWALHYAPKPIVATTG